ncbi:MAG TPA: shikimate dehydrogenase, partial [Candidatus Gracilibacteria bacterium]
MKHYAVIGFPIEHSRSPRLHQAAFGLLDMDDCHFEALEIKPEDLGSWIKNDFRKFYQGAAITVPHKIEALKYIDVPTDSAIKIGAINTLYWLEDKVIGTNTDSVGALKAVESVMNDVENKKVLILGAGGAARSIIFALNFAGMKVAVWNRTSQKAQALAQEFEVGYLDALTPEAFDLFDLIVNTTPVGLKKWESLVPADYWSPHQVAFDVVY